MSISPSQKPHREWLWLVLALLLVGGVTMLFTSLGGALIGLIAGYYRRLDLVVMRLMDGLMAFPAIILAIALMAARGPGVWNVIVALSLVYMPRTALLVRSTVLSLRELDYVAAAQALDFREFNPGKGTACAREVIRKHVEHLHVDRPLYNDHNTMKSLVKSGEILSEVEKVVGELS